MPAVANFAERFNALMNRESNPLDTVISFTSCDLPIISFAEHFKQKEAREKIQNCSVTTISDVIEKQNKPRPGQTNPKIDKAVELLDKGVSVEEVLNETGLSRANLIKCLHERKINWRKYNFPPTVDRRIHPNREKVMNMIKGGLSILEVVEELNDPTLKKDTVMRWCERQGIVPPPSRPIYLERISNSSRKKTPRKKKEVISKSMETTKPAVKSNCSVESTVDAYKNMLNALRTHINSMTVGDFMTLSVEEREFALTILDNCSKSFDKKIVK